MEKEVALLVFELMGSAGAESRLEAYGMLNQALEPDLFLIKGEKVKSAMDSVLRGYGRLVNRLAIVKQSEDSRILAWLRGDMIGEYLYFNRNIQLPHVNGGLYTAEISIETNPKKVIHGQRPTWDDGDSLMIRVKSKEFVSDEENFVFEIFLDKKEGGVVYVNGGAWESLNLGDYQVLGYLLEDIDR